MFSPSDVAEYYNTTQNHYRSWWNLDQSLSLHYGIWNGTTKDFAEALANTNQTMANQVGIEAGQKVLDAGCGVGGAAIFLGKNYDCTAQGITLSEKQVSLATQKAKQFGLSGKVKFDVANYCETPFEDKSFDVIWACESLSSCTDLDAFSKEAKRLLKPAGRLIMSDCFRTSETLSDSKAWIAKWGATWGVSDLFTKDRFVSTMNENGFDLLESFDYTKPVTKSAYRMYLAAIGGFLPSELYNLTHPNVSRFAKHHYRSGYYQWKALKANLWQYHVISMQLPK